MSLFTAVLIGLLAATGLAFLKSRYLGFAGQQPADFATNGPRFDMATHLQGKILCEGVIYGPTGRVSSRFVADMLGTWDGNSGTLAERFHYNSGSVQDRCWTLTLADDGALRATAPDVVGEGIGRASGCSVQMRYRIKLDAAAGGHVLDVIDWMYLMENGTVINRSQFRKFGLLVAELVATMRKVAE